MCSFLFYPLRTSGGVAWASDDDKTIFYTTKDMKLDRSDKVWRHTMGDKPEKDALIFHEKHEGMLLVV